MTRIVQFEGLLVGAALSLVGLTGCLGTPGGSGGDDDQGPPLVEQGLLCEGTVTVQGTFAIGAPQPEDVLGCWPVGTWTFKATMGESDCAQGPTLLPEYSFQVMRDLDDNETYTYLTQPGYEKVNMKVTSGGGGLCSGELMIYSEDGKKILNLRPSLYADGHLEGSGEYLEYDTDQWAE